MEDTAQPTIQDTSATQTPVAQQKHWFMPKKTLAFIVILVIITVVLLMISVFQKAAPTPQSTVSQSDYQNAVAYAKSNLTLSTPVIASSGAYQVDAKISTQTNQTTGVQLELNYDPQVLTNVDVKPGEFFKSPVELLKKIDPVKGHISYVIAVDPAQKFVSGNGIIAIITFNAAASAPATTISFSPETIVTAIGHAESVLNKSTDLTFSTQ